MKTFEFATDMSEIEFLRGLAHYLDRKTDEKKRSDSDIRGFALRVVEHRLTRKMQEERLGPTVRLDLTP